MFQKVQGRQKTSIVEGLKCQIGKLNETVELVTKSNCDVEFQSFVGLCLKSEWYLKS